MRSLTPMLCATGLAAEARIARAAGFSVVVGAGTSGQILLNDGRPAC